MPSHIEQKNFSGILNRDDEDDVRPPDHHRMAFNVKFRGNGQNKRVENLEGTRIIPNIDLQPGTNVTIGCFYDAPKQRLFWFNYNSITAHSINIIDLTTETITPLIICGLNTDGDILNFDIKVPIINVQIIYGDEQQGDVLYWINSQKLPCQININQQLNGDYGFVKKDFLNVIKAIPQIPPVSAYEDNTDVSVNNLNRYLFQPRYRFIYNNNDKSCWSSRGELPLPFYFGEDVNNPIPSLNADIAMVIQTGDTNVKKIEIAMSISNKGNQFSDPFSVDVLIKEDLSIPDNDTYVYRFFNDKAYVNIDLKEAIQLFDLVPIEANALELLNGNVLIYGGIRESYNPVTDFTNGLGNTTNITVSQTDSNKLQQPDILFASQDGNTLDGTGDIHIIVLGKVQEDQIFNVSDQTDTITYTALAGDTTVEVIAGLSASAVGFGYTETSSDDNNLYINKASALLKTFNLVTTSTGYSDTDSEFCYDLWSVYADALVYLDGDGRSCGAVSCPELSFSTLGYAEVADIVQLPKLTASIYHRPPLEAVYYQWVRTLNLKQSKFLYWISSFTFKDNVAGADGNLYAYVGIENLNQYIRDKPSANFLAYDFLPGDRIRFIKLYPTGGATIPQIEDNKDFLIQQQIENPIINGTEYKGQFLKIFLPTTNVNFDFGVQSHPPIASAIDYNNYFIKLYTPTEPASANNNVYFEFGERYAIGNAGTATRYHQGMLQNQSEDLVTPATFEFTQGDDYYRVRNINGSPELAFTVLEQDIHINNVIGMTSDGDLSTVGYLVKDTPPAAIFGATTWLINVVDGNEYTFNIRGNIVVQVTTDHPLDTFNVTMLIEDSLFISFVRVAISGDYPTVINKVYDVTIDSSFTVPAGLSYVFPLLFGVGQFKILSGNLIINDTSRKFDQFVIDQNFSDSFQSAVNSNGRAWVLDPNAAQVYNGALLRWGLAYQVNTNINQTNRFYDQNFDEIDISKGVIKFLVLMGRTLYVVQYRGVGWMQVYAKFLQDSGNTNVVTTTDEIITRNNIQYYAGEYGCGDHPESVAKGKTNFYFFDPIRGYWVRQGGNGLEPFSEIFKGQYYIRSLITPFNKTWDRSDGSYAKMLSCYNYFEEQITAMLQSGTNGSDSIDAYTFSFGEGHGNNDKGFRSFYDIYAEWITCVEDKMVAWLNGNIYFFDNTDAYNNFFGVQYNSYIEVSFNDARMIKKGWISVSQLANIIWEAVEITTQLVMGSNNQQESYLLQNHFSTLEGQYHASFRRASNSRGGIVNGQILKGGYMTVKFQPTDSSGFVYLSGVSVKWIDSPLTTH